MAHQTGTVSAQHAGIDTTEAAALSARFCAGRLAYSVGGRRGTPETAPFTSLLSDYQPPRTAPASSPYGLAAATENWLLTPLNKCLLVETVPLTDVNYSRIDGIPRGIWYFTQAPEVEGTFGPEIPQSPALASLRDR